MTRSKWVIGVVALCVFWAIGTIAPGMAVGGAAHGGEEHKSPKVGILLVAFGSSETSAQVSFENIQRKVTAAFPAADVRWAYTSHVIRAKLADRGKALDSPTLALARLQDEGFTRVVVQSLHTIAGAEYQDLERTVNGFKAMEAFQKIVLGDPLMVTRADVAAVVTAITGIIPKERKQSDAVVLMGHGTCHPASAYYSALAFQLQLKDANIFLGTVEGFPDMALVQNQMQARHIQKAFLMPFMSVAGEHAKNDMAGDDSDSWKSLFSKAGIECVPVMKGTAEYDAFVGIWVGHIRSAMEGI